MSRKYVRTWFWGACLVIGWTVGAIWLARNAGAPARVRSGGPASFQNIVLVGWDGCLKEDMETLMRAGKLPALEQLVHQGQRLDTVITTSLTETKPGWSEILTGYGPHVTGVYDNRVRYHAIPRGLTIFERLKKHFGTDGIMTIFLAGKLQNLGIRGRHRVLVNGPRKTWYDDTLWGSYYNPLDVVWHTAEPYYFAWRTCDVFKNGLGDPKYVGQAAIDALGHVGGRRFFMFAHFWEPDESGHDYGEGTPQYMNAIVDDDTWLGKIVDCLRQKGLYDQTLIYVTTDHGFDRKMTSHHFAPFTWVITNDRVPLVAHGDRKDITPTLLARFGVDLQQLKPTLDGKSLVR